jgi:hypothetical protein
VKRRRGKGFATEAAFGAAEYAWEKLRLSERGGDPAVTALIDARGKLIKAQIGEKLRSGMAAPQGSVASGTSGSNPLSSSGESGTNCGY